MTRGGLHRSEDSITENFSDILSAWRFSEITSKSGTNYPKLAFFSQDGSERTVLVAQVVMPNIDIREGSAAIGKQIVKLGFPKGALIVLIYRNKEFIIPSGGAILEAKDKLLVLADRKSLAESRSIVESKTEPKQLSAPGPE